MTGTFVASSIPVMGRIDLANSIAAAARNAQQRGEHKEAAELFARALRVLSGGTAAERSADLWEQIRSHPPSKTPAPGIRTADGGGRLDRWGRFLREPK